MSKRSDIVPVFARSFVTAQGGSKRKTRGRPGRKSSHFVFSGFRAFFGLQPVVVPAAKAGRSFATRNEGCRGKGTDVRKYGDVSANRSLRSCKEIAETAGLTDESVCPTLVRKGLCSCGAGAFACQPIFLQLLTVAAPIGAGNVRRLPARNTRPYLRNRVLNRNVVVHRRRYHLSVRNGAAGKPAALYRLQPSG